MVVDDPTRHSSSSNSHLSASGRHCPQPRNSPATATLTITENSSFTQLPIGTLRLSPVESASSLGETRSHVHWTEDTIDNEGLGRKKSNSCCIFHSDEKDGHCHSNGSDEDDGDDDDDADGKSKDYSPNSYEKQPKIQKSKLEHGKETT